ncbi:MAG: hypothetical protein H6815_13920 [Phycisphaeraceae bacterium]|nr:hypothetical protein [Phycisphaerales bacterium]MCB9861536.1 hypothetical protein [Phycisphaeraceae bacterium]
MTDSLSHPHVRAFCVGQAKSGTSSLAGLLMKHHRAAHEPERAQTLDLILREARGELDESAMRVYLLERDQQLGLAFDIAWANQFLVGHLVRFFPDAKFIVLIRDCRSWLQSFVGHLISRNVPADVIAFLDYWFRPDEYPVGSEDAKLGELGLYSVRAFLAAWVRHITVCEHEIPDDRKLVVRSHELNTSHDRIASFLEINPDSLDTTQGHRNRSTFDQSIDTIVDSNYVRSVMEELCMPHMQLWFPEFL